MSMLGRGLRSSVRMRLTIFKAKRVGRRVETVIDEAFVSYHACGSV